MKSVNWLAVNCEKLCHLVARFHMAALIRPPASNNLLDVFGGSLHLTDIFWLLLQYDWIPQLLQGWHFNAKKKKKKKWQFLVHWMNETPQFIYCTKKKNTVLPLTIFLSMFFSEKISKSSFYYLTTAHRTAQQLASLSFVQFSGGSVCFSKCSLWPF